MVTALLREALQLFEPAERIRPAENDEALLRWSRCVSAHSEPARARVVGRRASVTPSRLFRDHWIAGSERSIRKKKRAMRRSVVVVGLALALILGCVTTSHARWHGSFGGIGVGPFGPSAIYSFPPYYYAQPPFSFLYMR